jgi:serine/threonine-protein kinase
VLAFHCLTGRKPFDGETTGGVLLAIHTLAVPKPSRHVPSLPPAVDQWFARACAREREGRFASSIELANALSSALDVSVPPLTPHAEDVAPTPSIPTLSAVVPAVPGGGLRPRRTSHALLFAAAVAVALGAVTYAGHRGRMPASVETTSVARSSVTPSDPPPSLEPWEQPLALPVGGDARHPNAALSRTPESRDPGASGRTPLHSRATRSVPPTSSARPEPVARTSPSSLESGPAGGSAIPAASEPLPPAPSRSPSPPMDGAHLYAMPDVRR